MKPLHCLGSVMAITAVGVAVCPAGHAQAPSFTIENHQKMVTVKDGAGRPLFAQVVSSPNVKIKDVSLGRNRARLSLQDAGGKVLWSKTLNQSLEAVNVNGDWAEVLEKLPEIMAKASESLRSKGTTPNQSLTTVTSVEVVVGPDDRAVSVGGGFRSSNLSHHFVATLLKDGVAVQMDAKYFFVVLSPPAAAQAPAR